MTAFFTQCRFEPLIQPEAFRFFTWSRISRTTRPGVVGLYGLCRWWAPGVVRETFSESCE